MENTEIIMLLARYALTGFLIGYSLKIIYISLWEKRKKNKGEDE